MINGFNRNIIYDTSSYEAIIEFIRKNIITEPDEFIESYDEINRVVAKRVNIKLYWFIKEIDVISELKGVLRDNSIRETRML
ncbi:MAG: hypothetical protein BZ138_07160 [Methanosphaera sp. rholeuAM270]|nr:MAG: hypothetical protein BZ138_07160 [Methanosphaera sp. rholeuAM270]